MSPTGIWYDHGIRIKPPPLLAHFSARLDVRPRRSCLCCLLDPLRIQKRTIGQRKRVLMDGGIRSGQDVLKALTLGANGTFIGRPMLYGLGAGGEAGVARAFEIIRKEADVTMALLGDREIKNIGPHNIYSNDLVRGQGY